jgi:3',5'-cyclic AMP phosphodiesterase CpdA
VRRASALAATAAPRSAAARLAATLLLAAVPLLLLAACGDDAGAPARPAGGDTRQGTLRDPDGDGFLSPAPGEPLVPHTGLAPARPPGRVLARLAVIADPHVRDEESPARAPFLARLGGPFAATFRPQEALTAQVLTAAVRSVDALHPDAVVEAGDLVDETQENELDAAVTALSGGRVDPDSGAPGYRGPQAASDPDPFYYRPGVDAPRHPGLLPAAQQPFTSPGVDAPWYPVLGNHDALVEGELRPTARIRAIAVGDRALWEPPRGIRLGRSAVRRVLQEPRPAGSVPVPPDPRRRELGPAGAVQRLRAGATGRVPGAGRYLDYVADVAPGVRLIVLDLVRRRFGAEGVVHPGQAAWLRRALAAAGDRHVLVATHQALTSTRGGGALLSLLDHDPHVAAVLNGHTHRARITPRRTPAGGYWLISTPSLADYPQEARALELRETAGGGLAIDTWLLDTAPSPLADTARELAFLSATGGRPAGDAGTRADRNARLYLPPG